MPYIQKHLREQAFRVPLNAGELNYCLTRTLIEGGTEEDVRAKVDAYVAHRGQVTYATINEVVGVLTCVSMEAWRRKSPMVAFAPWVVVGEWYADVAGPYEDLKCAVNGDVYP